jgi:hypothetical protein
MAHLTDNWGVEVKKNEVSNYSRKGCHARKRVDLQKVKIKILLAQMPASTTNPDRPPVAATSLDDTPFKVKSREKLPAGKVAFESVIFCKAKVGASRPT